MPMPRVIDLNIEPMQVDLPENEGNDGEENFVVENPTLDLDSYSAGYKGIIKIQRLMFISNHCPNLAADALRICASEIKNSHNTEKYREILLRLSTIMDSSSTAQGQQPEIDHHWIETTDKKAQMKFLSCSQSPKPLSQIYIEEKYLNDKCFDRLDQDLKTYKNNSIKESIRRGHDDLGDHFVDCGNFQEALKCYSRARDYCICGEHVINMCINAINVSIYIRNWIHVHTYYTKAESIPDFSETSTMMNEKQKKFASTVFAKLKCAYGLAELSQKKYKAAANVFLEVSFDHLDYSQVLTASDVAIYGGICALATFDRKDLHKKVLSSSSFKQFLELQPQLREVIQKFYASQYATCLDLLNRMKDNLLLDVFLSPHINKLYTQIRNRALIQYFSPYVSADLEKMAVSFNCSVPSLEDELTQLILDGQISARIDSRKKILYARDVDHRTAIFEKALEVGKEYQRRTKALMLRTIVLKHQIQVRSNVEGAKTDDTPR